MDTDHCFLEQTLDLLHATNIPRREIASAAGVDYEWLAKLAQGRIADPGVRKIQRLHNYLMKLRDRAA